MPPQLGPAIYRTVTHGMDSSKKSATLPLWTVCCTLGRMRHIFCRTCAFRGSGGVVAALHQLVFVHLLTWTPTINRGRTLKFGKINTAHTHFCRRNQRNVKGWPLLSFRRPPAKSFEALNLAHTHTWENETWMQFAGRVLYSYSSTLRTRTWPKKRTKWKKPVFNGCPSIKQIPAGPFNVSSTMLDGWVDGTRKVKRGPIDLIFLRAKMMMHSKYTYNTAFTSPRTFLGLKCVFERVVNCGTALRCTRCTRNRLQSFRHTCDFEVG